MIVDRLLPAETPIVAVIDDTLFRRWGRKVHHVFWTHDGAAQGQRKIGRGNRWVIAGIAVRLPFCSSPVCLPVLFQAIRELDHAGTPITFEAVARAAGVSRSWLYAQPDLRAEIERLRATTSRAPAPSIPASQRASDTSLLQRLAETHQRNRQLAEENARLRRQLAHALGDQRTAARSATPDSHDPPDHSSVTT
jgi:hypothetical protein